uniref:TspO/MBR family protein n=1 Tax=Candidatus Planktophila sp. TaxID=2175601 RepID=UPI004049ED0E
MTTWRTISAVIGIAFVLIYAGGSKYWNRQDGWYQSLNQPSWQPPGFIFGLIWPYNFIVIGIALWVIASKASPALVATALSLFAFSVIVALRWSYLFYEVHDLRGATISLFATAILTIPLLAITFSQSIKVGIALIPYQIWIFTAAALNASYVKLN